MIMAHDVFISYSSRDKAVADSICATLEARRIRCWIAPRDVPVGQPWPAALVEAIGGSRVFVLVLSNGSNNSPQVLREVAEAMDKEIPAIPFRIDDVQPSKEMGYYIRGIHWLDAITLPIEKHLKSLAATVEALLAARAAEETPTGTPQAASVHTAAQPKPARPFRRNWRVALALLGLVFGILLLGDIAISLLKGGAFKMPAWFTASATSSVPVPVSEATRPAVPQGPTTQAAAGPENPTATFTSVATAPAAQESPLPAGRDWQNWTQVQSFAAPGAGPTGIVRVEDRLWVNVPCSNRIYGLDLHGGIVAELEMPKPGCGPRDIGLAWDGSSLWGNWGEQVVQIDPASGQTLSSFTADMNGCSLAWGDSYLWVVDRQGNLSVYDSTGERKRRLAIPVYGVVSGIAWVDQELWMLDEFGNINRFDQELKKAGEFSLSATCGISSFHRQQSYGLFWDGASLWVADSVENRIYQCAPGG
jgi:TIR domain